MWAVRGLPFVAVFLAACQTTPLPRSSIPPLPEALPAVDAVVAAFVDHQVVAIGETHGSGVQHAFLRSLLADPRLIGVIHDVAVEFGSARHQDTIDRYVQGEAVTEAELSLVWTDTTQQSGVWIDPIYRQFFELVRDQNLTRDADDRLRVLLGDPPIDWDLITDRTDCDASTSSCLDFWLMGRDEHFASVVREQSLARGRRALVIAGSGHILRNPGMEFPISLTDLLDATHPGQIWALLPVSRSNVAVLAAMGGTANGLGSGPRIVELDAPGLAEVTVDDVFARGTVTCDNPPCETPAPRLLREAADALLFL